MHPWNTIAGRRAILAQFSQAELRAQEAFPLPVLAQLCLEGECEHTYLEECEDAAGYEPVMREREAFVADEESTLESIRRESVEADT